MNWLGNCRRSYGPASTDGGTFGATESLRRARRPDPCGLAAAIGTLRCQKADINLIDFGSLRAGLPYMAADLPRGGKRLLQKASGYRRTIVSGVTTYLDGEPTGALPGRLVRAGSAGAPA